MSQVNEEFASKNSWPERSVASVPNHTLKVKDAAYRRRNYWVEAGMGSKTVWWLYLFYVTEFTQRLPRPDGYPKPVADACDRVQNEVVGREYRKEAQQD